jgi:hypothetical protein
MNRVYKSPARHLRAIEPLSARSLMVPSAFGRRTDSDKFGLWTDESFQILVNEFAGGGVHPHRANGYATLDRQSSPGSIFAGDPARSPRSRRLPNTFGPTRATSDTSTSSYSAPNAISAGDAFKKSAKTSRHTRSRRQFRRWSDIPSGCLHL